MIWISILVAISIMLLVCFFVHLDMKHDKTDYPGSCPYCGCFTKNIPEHVMNIHDL